jgi:hypothetical protein
MPYVEVAPENLVVGQEYVLTRKGLKPRVNEGLSYERRNIPSYRSYDLSARAVPLVSAVVPKRPETVVIPPTSKTALQDAYRALLAFEKRDLPYTEAKVDRLALWSRQKAPRYTVPEETDYLKRGFFAGNRGDTYVFTQQRTFGAKKPIAFTPVNVNEKTQPYGKLAYDGYSSAEWAFWELQGNNGTRRNAAARNNGTRRNRNVPTGNLLGLNNAPKAPRNNRSANQALNNLTKKHLLEQNLKGLF